jgi:metallophosphoesterase (TIGR00282 family)
MKIIMIGDIFGRAGRDALGAQLPVLRQKYAPDFVVANADNASHGAGPLPSTVKELYELGIDLLTGGDHIWNQREMVLHLDRSPWVLRPLNFPTGTPGKGFHILETADKRRLLVIHAQGRVYIDKLCDDPFAAIEKLLGGYELGKNIAAILLDFHAEATSEKMAMGHFLDGRVSVVVGTHTHVPTNDARILNNGTAYITDLGMTGDYNSVIGMQAQDPVNYFRTGLRLNRYKPAENEATVCGVFVETDDTSGKAMRIEPFKLGGVLGL